jgi:hypothetical protein
MEFLPHNVAALGPCTLIHREWRTVAQKVLFRCLYVTPFIQTVEDIHSWPDYAKISIPHLLSAVRTLFLRDRKIMHELPVWVELMKRLQSLCTSASTVLTLNHISLGTLNHSLTSLAPFVRLTHLTLDGCWIDNLEWDLENGSSKGAIDAWISRSQQTPLPSLSTTTVKTGSATEVLPWVVGPKLQILFVTLNHGQAPLLKYITTSRVMTLTVLALDIRNYLPVRSSYGGDGATSQCMITRSSNT